MNATLTDQQVAVLQGYASGLREPKVAKSVGISEGRVRQVVAAAKAALGVPTLCAAVAVATDLGLVSAPGNHNGRRAKGIEHLRAAVRLFGVAT